MMYQVANPNFPPESCERIDVVFDGWNEHSKKKASRVSGEALQPFS